MTRRNLSRDLFSLLLVPFWALTFIAIIEHAGRRNLVGYALMAPVLISLWQMALTVAGDLVNRDRWMGVMEGVVAAPAPFALVMAGRVSVVTAFGLLGFVEAWLVALLAFHIVIAIEHPVLLIAALVLAAFACSSTALLFSAVFTLRENTRVYQNSITFPFYVLGGVLVPVTYLPAWLQPFSGLVFLSWSADLLRDSLRTAPPANVWFRLGMVAVLGALTLGLGWALLERMIYNLRREGTLGLR